VGAQADGIEFVTVIGANGAESTEGLRDRSAIRSRLIGFRRDRSER
jgi:hypothetical protein